MLTSLAKSPLSKASPIDNSMDAGTFSQPGFRMGLPLAKPLVAPWRPSACNNWRIYAGLPAAPSRTAQAETSGGGRSACAAIRRQARCGRRCGRSGLRTASAMVDSPITAGQRSSGIWLAMTMDLRPQRLAISSRSRLPRRQSRQAPAACNQQRDLSRRRISRACAPCPGPGPAPRPAPEPGDRGAVSGNKPVRQCFRQERSCPTRSALRRSPIPCRFQSPAATLGQRAAGDAWPADPASLHTRRGCEAGLAQMAR